jgi:hypothetical protein
MLASIARFLVVIPLELHGSDYALNAYLSRGSTGGTPELERLRLKFTDDAVAAVAREAQRGATAGP